MASIAEIYDMLRDTRRTKDNSVYVILAWASCTTTTTTTPHHLGSLVNPSLSIVDVPFGFGDWFEDLRYNLQEGENHVTKALESNQPYYKAILTKHGFPYSGKYDIDGALAIKLSSINADCGDYVLEFLFRYPKDMRLEERKSLVDNVLCDLRNNKSRFVTCSAQGPIVELYETTNDQLAGLLTAKRYEFRASKLPHKRVPIKKSSFITCGTQGSETSDAMPIVYNQSAQSQPHTIQDNAIDRMDKNDNVRLQLLHDQGAVFLPSGNSTTNNKPTRENPLASSTNLNDQTSLGTWLTNLTVGNDMDVDWPPHQGPLSDPRESAIPNSRTLAPQKGFDLNAETSLDGVNQIVGYGVASSSRDFDLNDVLSFDSRPVNNSKVRGDMDVQCMPQQMEKAEQKRLGTLPFTPLEASQHPIFQPKAYYAQTQNMSSSIDVGKREPPTQCAHKHLSILKLYIQGDKSQGKGRRKFVSQKKLEIPSHKSLSLLHNSSRILNPVIWDKETMMEEMDGKYGLVSKLSTQNRNEMKKREESSRAKQTERILNYNGQYEK